MLSIHKRLPGSRDIRSIVELWSLYNKGSTARKPRITLLGSVSLEAWNVSRHDGLGVYSMPVDDQLRSQECFWAFEIGALRPPEAGIVV